MNNYVLLDFKSRLSDPAQLIFARNVLTRLKGNSNFPTLQSPLVDTELTEALQRFETALQEAADGGRTKIAQKNAALQQLKDVLERAAGYVRLIANGNEALVLDAGFRVRARATRSANTPLAQVQDQRARAGRLPGEAILEFAAVPGARLYAIEWSADNGQTWHNGTYSTTRKVVVQGLPVRQDLLLRVYAIGVGQHKGPHSEVARVFLV